ncbi:MAG TPA: DUF2304 family protein [Methanothermobacter sp.]|uniref:DUF2304 domain-containing protein n=1 Tax=Methanothermobacter tenebrarum TaxID=680118 RepID=A0ABN6PFR2_9EURY|nr:DUF2304 family protein [Methanothermobacter tenebrarum]MBK6586614.1 DUF2304 family protein [Coprothermobacter sp.]MDD3454450.1 DUF2304 family protein [Methanobacteriales archaeon]MDI6881407.1 DUF2304 family protein [Methanothermobacter sp.]MDX9692993.1 DUF2304 family protein [Methanothermobacter sp.]BDH79681.1 hypothetical protein MTTB_10600 [Methanothermobacter tenebrarum]
MLYQIIGVLTGLIGIIVSLKRFKEGRTSPTVSIIWLVVWFSLIIISISPNATSYLANVIGIGRGLDLILILAIIGAYYLLFRIYIMIENIEMEITKLVRELALREEEEQ